jgi:cell division protein FtsI/penicillin-binding protein 2
MKKILLLILLLTTRVDTGHSADLRSKLDEISNRQKCIIMIANLKTGDMLYSFNNVDDGTTAYYPGSTIKLLLSIMLVENGIAGSDFMVNCLSSSPEVPVEERCWYTPGHGLVDFENGFAGSCNKYFLNAATKVDKRDFIKLLNEFDIAGGKKLNDVNEEDMIGLGDKIKVTPEDLLSAYIAVINGGIVYRWHGLNEGDHSATAKKNVKIEKHLSEKIKEVMTSVSVSGTAKNAAEVLNLSPFPCKTGTAAYDYNGLEDYKKTHGWFVGFYPGKEPEIALLAFVLTGNGAKEASMLGGRIIKRYIEHNE